MKKRSIYTYLSYCTWQWLFNSISISFRASHSILLPNPPARPHLYIPSFILQSRSTYVAQTREFFFFLSARVQEICLFKPLYSLLVALVGAGNSPNHYYLHHLYAPRLVRVMYVFELCEHALRGGGREERNKQRVLESWACSFLYLYAA